jgi:hypothetical protein
VILITPLIDFGSYQTDYVKSAHSLGIPIAFLPFSWDNLTNRGLVRIPPDRALVWNEQQKREAVTYHGIRSDDVVVTGAPRFDDFFAMGPSTTREEFCARAGLDAARPFVLYLCSSHFVAPDEVAFVRTWARAIRDDPSLSGCGILVRPHPANLEPWMDARLDEIGNAAVWTEPPKVQADPALYDSLSHAAAVVGLNTSAMIEAGILDKPVLTLVMDEFAGGQEQTLHFHYLRASNGGLLHEAYSLEDHARQLGAALRRPGADEQVRRFVERFVRPRGLATPVTPIMVEEIERAAHIRKRPRRASPWHYAVRSGLGAAALWRATGRRTPSQD